jgi:hypothetical protein
MTTCKYFILQELVSEPVFNKYGTQAWQFFDPRLLETIDIVHDIFGRTMIINDWIWGGSFSQRGLRENLSPLVLSKTKSGVIYLSPHCLGKGVDFDIENTPAEETRQGILDNKSKLPYNIRLESNVSWVHLDVFDTGHKIYFFSA